MAHGEFIDTEQTSGVVVPLDGELQIGEAQAQTMNAPDEAAMIFEFDRLHDVCMHEAEAERQFLGDLLALVPHTLARIASLVQAGDAPEVHASAHALKGHCLMLGANALGRVCGELEYDAEMGLLHRGRELVARAELELIRVRTLLDAYFGDDD